jgi:hypothetical protein
MIACRCRRSFPWAMLAFLGVLLLEQACPLPGTTCAVDEDCPPGALCAVPASEEAGVCRWRCTADTECEEPEPFCVAGVCDAERPSS